MEFSGKLSDFLSGATIVAVLLVLQVLQVLGIDGPSLVCLADAGFVKAKAAFHGKESLCTSTTAHCALERGTLAAVNVEECITRLCSSTQMRVFQGSHSHRHASP